jgi:hypothetical protein
MKNSLYYLFCIVFLFGFSYLAHTQIITTFAGNGIQGYSGDGGAATLARLHTPTCLAIDGADNIYINDQNNNCIRRVSPAGIITTVAGNGLFGSSGDGGPATAARLGFNWGAAVDAAGNIYIADQSNLKVRKVNTSGIISTFAGNGSPGYSGDNGPATAATMKNPIGIAVDNTGSVFIGDPDNFCIRKVGTDGIITTCAGNGIYGYSGDGGPATNASLSTVWGLATDAAGNLYLCDGPNNRVRKVTPAGIITTVAGIGGVGGYSGDNGQATAAELNLPLGVFATSTGVLLISDCKNHRLRRVNTDGVITTVAGTGIAGYNGDGMPATTARLNEPIGVVVDTSNNIYVADLVNERIRKINVVLSFVAGEYEHIGACQNSGPVPINAQLAVNDVYVGLTDVWTLHTAPAHGTAIAGYSTLSTGGVLTPVGLSYTPDPGYTGPDSFTVRVANALADDLIKIYVSVDPILAPGTITGPASVCFGDTLALAATVAGGTWSIAGSNLSILSAGPSACVVRGVAVGTDVVSYHVGNACGTTFTTRDIVINPLPAAGTVSGPGALCLGAVVSFAASLPGGTWSTSNLNASVDFSGTVKGLAAGTATIIYTITDTVCRATAIQTITIETFPDPGSVSGPVNVCLGGEIELSSSVPGGVWSSNYGYAAVSLGLVTGVALGNDFINYSITNTCGTAIATRPVSVHPVPDIPLVTVDQGTLSATAGYAAYQWRLNGAAISGAVSDSFYAASPGVYEVVVANT